MIDIWIKRQKERPTISTNLKVICIRYLRNIRLKIMVVLIIRLIGGNKDLVIICRYKEAN